MYDIVVDLDLEVIVVSSLQLVHVIVILRLAINMVFIIALSRWFSRAYLHLTMVSIVYVADAMAGSVVHK